MSVPESLTPHPRFFVDGDDVHPHPVDAHCSVTQVLLSHFATSSSVHAQNCCDSTTSRETQMEPAATIDADLQRLQFGCRSIASPCCCMVLCFGVVETPSVIRCVADYVSRTLFVFAVLVCALRMHVCASLLHHAQWVAAQVAACKLTCVRRLREGAPACCCAIPVSARPWHASAAEKRMLSTVAVGCCA